MGNESEWNLDRVALQTAAERGGYGGERYEKLEFQKKVEQKFKSLEDSTWQVWLIRCIWLRHSVILITYLLNFLRSGVIAFTIHCFQFQHFPIMLQGRFQLQLVFLKFLCDF